mgnify:CR=1 FL=1
MRSPDRKLSTREVARKRKKLDKTLGQLEGLKEGTRKHHRKMFKAEKTLDQVRTGYSGIRPNKSAFNRNEVAKDSLGEKDAWAKWEKGYMDRTHKFKGTKFQKPITPEENRKEMNAERGEFKYDKQTGQIRLKKTDDAENPIERQTSYGESRGEGHKSGERFRYDPADKKAFQSLNQQTKDSLQGEAYKYNKPFFSPKHGVNVDPEDGVLSNRPIYSDNTKLTYDKIDKPFSESGINRKSALNMVGLGVSRNSRCWEGYEPTPGVKPYAKGSCRKK